MNEPSRKRQRGNSVVQSVEDIVNEVTVLREEITRVKIDNERLSNDNTGLQGDICEVKKLGAIRIKELWDLKKEKKKLEKRVNDRDIDVYEQGNLIEELQGKLKTYDTERQRQGWPVFEITDTERANTLQHLQPIFNERTTSANIPVNDPAQNRPYSKISLVDHVADAAEIGEQILADTTQTYKSSLSVVAQAMDRFHSREPNDFHQTWVYGRSRRELIFSIQAAVEWVQQGTLRAQPVVVCPIFMFSEFIGPTPLSTQLSQLAMSRRHAQEMLRHFSQQTDQALRNHLVVLIVFFKAAFDALDRRIFVL